MGAPNGLLAAAGVPKLNPVVAGAGAAGLAPNILLVALVAGVPNEKVLVGAAYAWDQESINNKTRMTYQDSLEQLEFAQAHRKWKKSLAQLVFGRMAIRSSSRVVR